MSEAVIKFGMYDGNTLDKIPLDYLFWLFPRLKQISTGKYSPGKRKRGESSKLYGQILEYFLTQDIRVEDHSDESKGYCFYFNRYKKLDFGGTEMPFVQSFWRGKDSTKKMVYTSEAHGNTWFIVNDDNRYHLSTNYVSHRYIGGISTMIYEKNPNYCFYDGYGRLIQNAFLMREPKLENRNFIRKFSKNININKLNK